MITHFSTPQLIQLDPTGQSIQWISELWAFQYAVGLSRPQLHDEGIVDVELLKKVLEDLQGTIQIQVWLENISILQNAMRCLLADHRATLSLADVQRLGTNIISSS